MSSTLTPELKIKLRQLEELIHSHKSALVAFSGGVDSTLVLKIASRVLKDKVVAITAKSPSIPAEELQLAKDIAEQLDVKHIVIESDELSNSCYRANDPERCYHCKKLLFSKLQLLAEELALKTVFEGSNRDDGKDYRPGTKAAVEFSVVSPLKALGFTKEDIRLVAKAEKLPNWNRPASSCLATRIPYNTPISEDLLSRIEKAERFLKELGVQIVRVRDHGSIALIEVEQYDMERLVEPEISQRIYEYFDSLGYNYTALDLIGYRSGNLNKVLDDLFLSE